MGYAAFVALGVGLAFLATRLGERRIDDDERGTRAWITLAAVLGASLGAHGLAAIASWHGWIDGVAHAQPLGDRTVLGGLLVGWLAVEVTKIALHDRRPTGDRFAAPLAIALTFGRLGCWSAGCCGGHACAVDDPWRAWAMIGADGAARVPVQAIEAGFHAIAAIALLIAQRRDALTDRRLAAYLTCYAVLRFVLETARVHPPILLGMTWFQLLAIALAVLAGSTWWRRARAARRLSEPTVTATPAANA